MVLAFSRQAAAWLRAHGGLLALLLLALLLRLALWAQPLHEPANDEIEYITVARDLLAGRGWVFYEQYHWLRAPLYPLWLAGSLWLAGGDLHLAALPNLLLSVANVALVYLLTRQVVGSVWPSARATRAALLATGLAALLFTWATFASLSMSETLFTFWLTLALLLLLRWQQAPPRRGQLALLALAGVAYGLATLTRSLSLAFLPVVLLWLLLAGLHPLSDGRALRDWRALLRRLAPRLLAGLLFAGCVLLTIAPWTLRNCQAYGQCILVETGFSFNMWVFNEPRESRSTIFRTLESIPNPAERAEEATRRGLERLQEDPAIMLRKLYPNWVYIWRIKPIQDRFLMWNYYADPPPLVFLAALLLDDALYVALLALSTVGLVRLLLLPNVPRPPDAPDAPDPPQATSQRTAWLVRGLHAPSVLLALWVCYVVAASMLTHGEARYRHFFFPVLLLYGAVGLLVLVGWLRNREHSTPPRWLALLRTAGVAVLLVLLLHTVLLSYPWGWAERGFWRSVHRLAGDVALWRGDLDAAAQAYEQALAAQRTADGWIALGDVQLARGDLEAAAAAYELAWRKERLYYPASARLGAVLRTLGGREAAARRAFEGTNVPEQAVLDWSWAQLAAQPGARVDVGGGLDFGYVGGMYPAEIQQGASARWTNGHGRLRVALPAPLQGANEQLPVLVGLRLAAPHPAARQVTAHVCLGNCCQQAQLTPRWRTIWLLLPPRRASPASHADARAVLELDLYSPTFTAADGRTLGVLVDWVAAVPAREPRPSSQ